jgi:ATP-dependent DNA ligase
MKTQIMKNFAPLFSLNSNGSIQRWSISVEDNRIIKEYGQIDGKMQTASDIVKEGKNIGKSNETSPEQQAIAEATAQWEKKLKSGYSKTQKDAKAGKVDIKFVTGGIEPMLAHKFRDHADKIKFPAFVQPKLDGIRCIAMIVDGVATLWSRTRKPITGVPHIVKDLETKFPAANIIFDGELYNHSYKNKFEEIVSFVRQEIPKEGHKVVQYHIYDIVDTTKTFKQRQEWLVAHRENIERNTPVMLSLVHTHEVEDEDVLMYWFTSWRLIGYEGAMVRNSKSMYEGKRSYGLQKIKEFDDAEFKITGIKAGRGRMAECAIFTCTTSKGDLFDCKMEGSLDVLKEILKNPRSVIGKMLTVRYQGLTNGNLPRFPIGVCVRDYE